ncbi:MAG: LURP-one-related family protein [Firmicutes bacterium]|nr:LURP-one-related family protein [Bacillota bacterium]
MRLHFKQRLFSWFDSYDIYDEEDRIVYTVEGKLAWGHKLVIYDANGQEAGMVHQEILTLLPKFNLYDRGQHLGAIKREFTFFKPAYNIDFNGWRVEGNWLEWDYAIFDAGGRTIASISKDIWHLTDHYFIDVKDKEDALHALMVVLAIDADKCSQNNG